MHDQTNGNGRDGGDQWVEALLSGAGASIGRVLDERQVHAANLAIEVFAYLLAGFPSEKVAIYRSYLPSQAFMRGGLNNAKGE